MLKVTLYRRVPGTWAAETFTMTPTEAGATRRRLRAALAERRAAFRAKGKRGAGVGGEPTDFQATPIGSLKWGGMSGTLSDLTAAGLCVACLGHGRDRRYDPHCGADRDHGPCPHCGGSGDYPAAEPAASAPPALLAC